MKELIFISGKGGTGKTSLMVAFSSLAGNKVLCDADVECGRSAFNNESQSDSANGF